MRRLFWSLFLVMSLSAEIRYVQVENQAILPYIKDMTTLCNTVYAEYPYRYDGNDDDYDYYLANYAKTPKSFMCVAFDDDKAIGIATCIPLIDYRSHYIKPFVDQGYPLAAIAYHGELILLPEYRGQGIGKALYLSVENWARNNQFPYIAFAQIDESKIPVAPPADYVPVDGFWDKLGFTKHPELQFNAFYKCVGEDEETYHPMYYWLKKL